MVSNQPGICAGRSGRGRCGSSFHFWKKSKAGSLTGACYRWISTSSMETTFPSNVYLDSQSLGVTSCRHPQPTLCLVRQFPLCGWKQVAALVADEQTRNRQYYRVWLDQNFFYSRGLDMRGDSWPCYAQCRETIFSFYPFFTSIYICIVLYVCAVPFAVLNRRGSLFIRDSQFWLAVKQDRGEVSLTSL